MRYLIPLGIALVVGVSAGLGVAYFDLGSDTAHLEVGVTDAHSESGPGMAAVEVVGGTHYNFGSIEIGRTGHHVFAFRNVGTAPLQLNVHSTTCKCTVGTLERDTVPPGETVEVRMEWTPPHFTEEFRQKATIATNDPNQREIDLTVVGRVDIALRAIPDSLPLGSVQVNEPRSVSTKVYGFREGGFEITEQQFLRENTAEYFETETRPLTEEELTDVLGAQAGYEVTFSVLPGLPMGTFEQTLEITTDMQEVDPVEIVLYGELVGDISLVGPEVLDPAHNLLKLDLVRSGQGRTETIYVIVKGPHRDDIELQVGEIDPAGVLQASLGERTEMGNGRAYRYPLEISIPPGTESINRLGGSSGGVGTIRIESGHADTPSLILRIQFAVEG